MKTFGIFMVLLLGYTIGISWGLPSWTVPEIMLQSTLLAYISTQFILKELK